MESLVANIGGRVRRETLHGRSYLVAPVRMLVEGVLEGSEGPIFYSRQENHRRASAWDAMPILNGHPYHDGKPGKGRDPAVWQRSLLGHVFNTVGSDDGGLDSETWFDLGLCSRVEPRLIPALESGRKIEVSTGLYLTKTRLEEPRVHNGRTYQVVASDYQPDHLAVLLDGQGACSIRDGCGVFNAKTKTVDGQEYPASDFAYVGDPNEPSTWKLLIHDARHVGMAAAAMGEGFRSQKVEIPEADMAAVRKRVRAAWKKFHPNMADADMPMALHNEASAAESLWQRFVSLFRPTANAAGPSHDELRMKLHGLLMARYGMSGMSMSHDGPPPVMLADVYDKSLVYEANGKLWELGYTTDLRSGAVALAEGPSREVQRVSSYKPVANETPPEVPPESQVMTKPVDTPQRREAITFLTTNCDCWKDPARLPILEAMDDAALTALRGHAEAHQKATLAANAARQGFTDAAGTKHAFDEKANAWVSTPKAPETPTPTTNAQKPQTPQEWLAAAPPEVQSLVRNAQEAERREKQAIVETLLANISDQQQRQARGDRYMAKPLEELRELAELFGRQASVAPAPLWTGAAPAFNAAAGRDDSGNLLPAFAMDWVQSNGKQD